MIRQLSFSRVGSFGFSLHRRVPASGSAFCRCIPLAGSVFFFFFLGLHNFNPRLVLSSCSFGVWFCLLLSRSSQLQSSSGSVFPFLRRCLVLSSTVQGTASSTAGWRTAVGFCLVEFRVLQFSLGLFTLVSWYIRYIHES
ncbi:hypothetical protein HN51_048124 [Arachis hypogaea]